MLSTCEAVWLFGCLIRNGEVIRLLPRLSVQALCVQVDLKVKIEAKRLIKVGLFVHEIYCPFVDSDH